MAPRNPGVVLLTDQLIMSRSVRAVLDAHTAVDIVAETTNGRAAAALAASHGADVVLLARGSSIDGTDAGAREEIAAAAAGRAGVVVLADTVDNGSVHDAIRAGARGYVVADTDVDDLVRVLVAVSQGQNAFDPRSASAITRHVRGDQPEPIRLSAREQQVLHLVAHGLSNRAIGNRLYIAESTVKFHLRHLMQKMSAQRRSEVVYTATQRHLL